MVNLKSAFIFHIFISFAFKKHNGHFIIIFIHDLLTTWSNTPFTLFLLYFFIVFISRWQGRHHIRGGTWSSGLWPLSSSHMTVTWSYHMTCIYLFVLDIFQWNHLAHSAFVWACSPLRTLASSPWPTPPENQVLHYPGYHFVLDLVLACRSFIANPSNENNAVLKIFQFLNSTDQGFTESQRAVMAFDSLENLAARCSQAEENITVTHFIFMLNAIQLCCKVIRFTTPISCLV